MTRWRPQVRILLRPRHPWWGRGDIAQGGAGAGRVVRRPSIHADSTPGSSRISFVPTTEEIVRPSRRVRLPFGERGDLDDDRIVGVWGLAAECGHAERSAAPVAATAVGVPRRAGGMRDASEGRGAAGRVMGDRGRHVSYVASFRVPVVTRVHSRSTREVTRESVDVADAGSRPVWRRCTPGTRHHLPSASRLGVPGAEPR